MEKKQFESSFLTMRIENSILIGKYKEGLRIDLEIAKQIVRQRLAYIEGGEYLTFVDVRNLVVVDREAREYFATEGVVGVVALALLVENFISTVASSIFLTFNKPKVPTRVFRDGEQALKWLGQFNGG